MLMVTKVPGSGTGVLVARVQLAEIEVPFCVNDMAAWAGDGVRPSSNGPGVYVPVKSSPRWVGVTVTMSPPVASNVPYLGFEMEKPPPVENLFFVTVNEPNDVNSGIPEKSPVPSSVVRELIPNNVVAVSRLRPTMETETPVKARDPLIALACNMVVQTVITAKRNK